MTGTHKIESNKIIARGDFGLMNPNPCVFTSDSDGTIIGPKATFITGSKK